MAVDLIWVTLYEFAVGIIGLLITIPIFKRHLERKTAVTRYLLLGILCLLFAAIISGVSRVFRITGAWDLGSGMYLELLAVSVSLIAASDIFLLAFCLEVFFEGAWTGKSRLIMLLYTIAIGVYVVFALTTGLTDVDLNDIIWVILIALSVIVYIVMIRAALRHSRKIEDPVGKVGMKLIAAGPACLLFTFALFMVDSFAGAGFTIFYFIAWAFAVAFVFVVYVGYLMPDWLKKRLLAKHQDS